MTILYTVHPGGQYVNLENISDEEMQSGIKVYVNATNRCPCSCTFCLRTKKHMAESNTLWLKREPTLEEILAEFKKYDLNNFKEVIFCGFGEPLVRSDDLMQVADYIKGIRPDLPIRVNTVGLANQVHNRDIIPELKGRIDTVSISLNTPSKEEYYKLTRSKFGPDSQDYMLAFAKECKDYIPHVVLTVVDHVISDEEIAQCQKICDRLGVTLRVRPYEEN
ncbi:MAG: TatD family nuclease-associated radical SAM protein [Intestinibaculum porci]|uniref:TatD family nuclease-associated radical SAM protein n=1 Tax=Intestinibaculum porci TaxID=2487118 RepID=UPI002409C455|nr:TatD family nuclease-associated radical SAM protein [Intestinibaculum porci]MDD6421684.1 TatD family nuclease-associated radical SAM protein [Intestinibaculum porci]